MEIQIRQARTEDAHTVTSLVERLLIELGGFNFDFETTVALCQELLAGGKYTAFLAIDASNTPLGVLTLMECSALYVSGQLGWIQELYVAPEARSSGAGHLLIAAATEYARQRGWKRLEVNTPNAPAWPRTVAFYRREGFIGESYHLRKLL